MELSIDIYHPSQVLPCFPRAPSTVKLLPKGLALSDRTNLIRVGPSHRPTNYYMYLLYQVPTEQVIEGEVPVDGAVLPTVGA